MEITLPNFHEWLKGPFEILHCDVTMSFSITPSLQHLFYRTLIHALVTSVLGVLKLVLGEPKFGTKLIVGVGGD